ncbi:hypothetical protein PTB13_26870, partial [Bacillus sp. MHSD17]|nr:hypothetical protein [Bacillus sp. MHSD17]
MLRTFVFLRPLGLRLHVTIKSKDEQIITIQSEEITLNLNGLPTYEFPNVPLINDHAKVQVEIEQLIEVFKQTVFAVAKNESRPVLTGVHLELDHNKLICVATDSHRLAIREMIISTDTKASCIVPSATISELLKLMKVGGQAVLGRQMYAATPWLTERH